MFFGVNYTPRKNWFHAWLDPDFEAMRQDFEAIKSIGLDHIRMFHLWPLLQPNRTFINQRGLNDLAKAVSIATQCGLNVYVDALQGHLSSFDFDPSWLRSWHSTNFFADPLARIAQKELISAIWQKLSGFAGFKGLTVGNEVNQYSYSGHPNTFKIDSGTAQTWTSEMLSAVPADEHHPPSYQSLRSHEADRLNGIEQTQDTCSPNPATINTSANRIATHSCYDASWIYSDHPFTPALVARFGDLTSVHSWIFNGTAQNYGGDSFEANHMAEYSIELFRAFEQHPGLPVDQAGRATWLQEIGAPLNVLTPEQVPNFVDKAIDAVLDCQSLWGITWWCSHDVSRDLADFPELEYGLGLFDSNGELKPVGEAFAKKVKQYRDVDILAVKPRDYLIEIPVDHNLTPHDRSRLAPKGDLFDQWMTASKAGKRPSFKLRK